SRSMVFRSLMICIDQRIIAERQETFSKPIGGVPLCAGEHLGVPSARHYSGLDIIIHRISDTGGRARFRRGPAAPKTERLGTSLSAAPNSSAQSMDNRPAVASGPGKRLHRARAR